MLRPGRVPRLVGGRAVVVRDLAGWGRRLGTWPGEVVAGLWQVAIGLYKVPAAGVRYEVTAEVVGGAGWARRVADALAADGVAADGVGGGGRRGAGAVGAVAGQRPGRRSLPAAPGRTWLAGDLHAHTVHSDGAMTVPELAAHAVARGLDFVAVTDHNTVSHHRELGLRLGRLRRHAGARAGGDDLSGHAGVLGRHRVDRLQDLGRRRGWRRPSAAAG